MAIDGIDGDLVMRTDQELAKFKSTKPDKPDSQKSSDKHGHASQLRSLSLPSSPRHILRENTGRDKEAEGERTMRQAAARMSLENKISQILGGKAKQIADPQSTPRKLNAEGDSRCCQISVSKLATPWNPSAGARNAPYTPRTLRPPEIVASPRQQAQSTGRRQQYTPRKINLSCSDGEDLLRSEATTETRLTEKQLIDHLKQLRISDTVSTLLQVRPRKRCCHTVTASIIL
jgi:hypothetical protein